MLFLDEFYFGEPVSPLRLRENISILFEDVVKRAGATSGIIVLVSEDYSCYEEVSSFGYRGDGFFYEFMTRGNGYFEKLSLNHEPMVFRGNEYGLYNQDSYCATVTRIYAGAQILGFLLLEFREEPGRLLQIFQSLVSDKIALTLYQVNNSKKEFTGSFEVMAFLIHSIPAIETVLGKLKPQIPALISGPPGSGKKTMAKFIHSRIVSAGRLLVLNSYPEQAIKLEKSLLTWLEMSANGMIVLDKLHELGLGQQRVLYDFLQTNPNVTAVFIDSYEKKEILPALWEKLNQHQIIMPSLDSLEKQILEGVILRMFEDLLEINNRKGLSLGKDSLSKLKFNTYPGGLTELRNILENAIQNSIGKEISVAEVKTGVDIPLRTPDVEDLDLRRCVESLERQKIVLASKLFSGNQIRMAKALGISRGSLQYKMRQMGLG